ncbi:MAG: SdrD B-like domain-containing protein, partial [Caldilinea sp.]
MLIAYSVPTLSDIEFDLDGSMILGFNDRTGMQTGRLNWSTNSSDNGLYGSVVGGDILRAFPSGNTYVLENQGRVGGVTGYSATNNEGPGSGEFYDDKYTGAIHDEISFGALAVLPGSGEVAVTMMDPLNVLNGGGAGPRDAGGIRYLNNLTGGVTRSFVVYAAGDPLSTELGKSTGLGDLELLCDTVSSLEIGNRVWADLDFDGVQDPSEPGIAGVQVTLYKNGVQVGSPVPTDSAGNYLFNSGLEANTAYEVRISQSQMASLGYPGLTTANAAQGGAPDADIRDSDAVLTSGNAVIQVTTGTGQVSHTLDFGFTLPAQFGDRVWVESDTDGLANMGVITLVAGMGITATGANGTVYTTTTNAQGYYSFTVAAGTYT